VNTYKINIAKNKKTILNYLGKKISIRICHLPHVWPITTVNYQSGQRTVAGDSKGPSRTVMANDGSLASDPETTIASDGEGPPKL
jgi:hypothetical protein